MLQRGINNVLKSNRVSKVIGDCQLAEVRMMLLLLLQLLVVLLFGPVGPAAGPPSGASAPADPSLSSRPRAPSSVWSR